MNTPMIVFKDVTKEYRLFKNNRLKLIHALYKRMKKYTIKKAVNDISFQINRCESVAIIGKNGAGKSTLLKMITSVCFPTEGDVQVNGRVSALLELTSGFEKEFTGRENIHLKATTLGLHKAEIKQLEQSIVDFADIGEYIDQPVRSYSSGMKARLGFAINANINPEILIIDEALSVGDSSFKKKCYNKIQSLLENENITLLLVTHSMDDAKEFCSRAIVLDKGKLCFDGDIDEGINYYKENITKK